MSLKITLSICLLCCFFISDAQPLTLLKKIGTVDPNTQSGLGQSFIGRELNDGNVYFRASHDGFVEDMWMTDGSTSGTVKILSESSTGTWTLFDFVPEGIFLQTGSDHLFFYDITTKDLIDLGLFDNEDFLSPAKFDEDRYIYFTENDGVANLFITDMTSTGTYSLGTVGDYASFMTMTASSYGAAVFNTNSFSSYVPMMYVAATDQIVSVKDFLAPYKEVTSVKKAVMHDHYMFLELIEDGFNRKYTFDLQSNAFYTGNSFFGDIEAFYSNEGELIIVSDREIVTMDTATFEMKEWTEDVYPLGRHILRGDTIYYHGYTAGDIVKLHIFDINTHEITVLENSNIGQNHYDGSIEIHKGELYYTHDTGATIFLRKYNYGNESYEDIDSITVRNGGLTIRNGVLDVNGVLLVSKFSPEEGHELYHLTGPSGIFSPYLPIASVDVSPNPSSDKIFLQLNDDPDAIFVYDAVGKGKRYPVEGDQSISISSLAPGMYHGVWVNGKRVYRFSFVKQN